MKRTLFTATRLTATGLLTAQLIALATPVAARTYWFGADLSFINEMKDCGARYNDHGETDPYAVFARSGTNLVRVRLWNHATWTRYSDLADVMVTIAAAKAQGQKVLLDFHYSDDWADGGKQLVPAAWAKLSDDDQVKALYQFTFDTLGALKARGLMPDMVQVGNETNGELLRSQPEEHVAINWTRNARLFNAGIQAVRDASADSPVKPEIMLHIAQPENVEPWFDAATAAGVTGYDIIGMSYYRKWSTQGLDGLARTIRRVHAKFARDVVVVETAYPFTDDWADSTGNLLGSDSALPAYPVTPAGQAAYMHDLMQLTLDNGGIGVVYWAPDRVSTHCRTRWGQGSDWENAAFFDFKGLALPALDWPKAGYVLPVEVTFAVPDTGQAGQVLTADFTDGLHVAMTREVGRFVYRAWLRPGSSIMAGTATSDDQVDEAEALSVVVPAAGGTVILGPSQP